MHFAAGNLLISSLLLDDANFDRVVILIAEHNEKGSMGFVVNKLFPRKFNELREFNDSIAFPLYAGGPVKTEHLFFLHQRPDLVPGGIAISDSLYLGGDFKQAVALINNRQLSENDIRLFIGYCGWDDKELEEEVAEGSWLIINEPGDVFSADPDTIWESIMQQ